MYLLHRVFERRKLEDLVVILSLTSQWDSFHWVHRALGQIRHADSSFYKLLRKIAGLKLISSQIFPSCHFQDPVYKYPPASSVQQTCTFKELVYETVKIPGCADHAESFYSYPVATECHCESCDIDNTDCTVRGLGPSYCSFNQNQSKE